MAGMEPVSAVLTSIDVISALTKSNGQDSHDLTIFSRAAWPPCDVKECILIWSCRQTLPEG